MGSRASKRKNIRETDLKEEEREQMTIRFGVHEPNPQKYYFYIISLHHVYKRKIDDKRKCRKSCKPDIGITRRKVRKGKRT